MPLVPGNSMMFCSMSSDKRAGLDQVGPRILQCVRHVREALAVQVKDTCHEVVRMEVHRLDLVVRCSAHVLTLTLC